MFSFWILQLPCLLQTGDEWQDALHFHQHRRCFLNFLEWTSSPLLSHTMPHRHHNLLLQRYQHDQNLQYRHDGEMAGEFGWCVRGHAPPLEKQHSQVFSLPCRLCFRKPGRWSSQMTTPDTTGLLSSRTPRNMCNSLTMPFGN